MLAKGQCHRSVNELGIEESLAILKERCKTKVGELQGAAPVEVSTNFITSSLPTLEPALQTTHQKLAKSTTTQVTYNDTLHISKH